MFFDATFLLHPGHGTWLSGTTEAVGQRLRCSYKEMLKMQKLIGV